MIRFIHRHMQHFIKRISLIMDKINDMVSTESREKLSISLIIFIIFTFLIVIIDNVMYMIDK